MRDKFLADSGYEEEAMWRLIRNGLFGLASAITVLILTPVIGGYFQELARKSGLYDEPLPLLNNAMNAIWDFVTQTWFLVLYGFILGLLLGLWLDRLLRNSARTAALKALVVLRATGTATRNALLGQRADFDYEREREELRAWSNEVLAKLEDAGVSLATRSQFQTIGEFIPRSIGVQGRNPPQVHLEAIWNEKLDQLRDIIDFHGS